MGGRGGGFVRFVALPARPSARAFCVGRAVRQLVIVIVDDGCCKGYHWRLLSMA